MTIEDTPLLKTGLDSEHLTLDGTPTPKPPPDILDILNGILNKQEGACDISVLVAAATEIMRLRALLGFMPGDGATVAAEESNES